MKSLWRSKEEMEEMAADAQHAKEMMMKNDDRPLRKWCLEKAIETRELTGVAHMVVTNLAEDYYLWITEGQSQSNRQLVETGVPIDFDIEAAKTATHERTA